ncbi:MAG TPA: alpha/beta hydrolase [Candidatus Binataceae bacterium]|nr:alpha/beta hydrolase [Candidatus Binataceae bacterium]
MATRDFAQSKDGLKIRYEIRGAGAPVVLIMGFSGSGRTWGEPFLKLMAERFRIFMIDNRGTGESDHPDRAWKLSDMADDVACVLEHTGTPASHVYGISMGGMIAQEYTLTYPARVKGLILGCTHCGAAHSVAANPENIAKLMPQPGMNPLEAAQLAFSAVCGKAFLNSAAGQQTLAARMADSANYPITPAHTYMRQAAAIAGYETFARLGEIKAPTLVIHGDDDNIVPVGNAEILHRGIAGSKLKILPGAGHMFFWERPEDSAKIPGDFLAGLK